MTAQDKNGRAGKFRVGRYEIRLPKSRPLRIAAGVALVVFGIFGFLPVVGFWMIPLGLLVLSNDSALIRRWRRRFEVWIARKTKTKTKRNL